MTEQKLPYVVGDRVDVALRLSVYEGGRLGPRVSGRVIQMRPAGLPDRAAEEAALYTAFTLGTPLASQQRAALRPSREETAVVYRLVRAGQVRCGDLSPVFARLSGQAGKVLVSLRALEELGLIGRHEAEGVAFWRALPVRGKRDLAGAPILRALEM